MKSQSNNPSQFVGIDLFAGAGGLSVGALSAGVEVAVAIEKDAHAADTYRRNHPKTTVHTTEVSAGAISKDELQNKPTILFGGPPCQGFSTSNQRTRAQKSEKNSLFKKFFEVSDLIKPDALIFENVHGILLAQNKLFLEAILREFRRQNYKPSIWKLQAADFGVPQQRTRIFIVAVRGREYLGEPEPTAGKITTVKDAISDLPKIRNGAATDYLPYDREASSEYAKLMRNGEIGCRNHLVTKNSEIVLKRYASIRQGENWEAIPETLMLNYKDKNRCHTGIYRRLSWSKPSVVIGNFRKNMLIHPSQNRGLSVREAARLQSFPDSYIFEGSIGFQQQQVGNAVPPLLAKAVFERILIEI